MQHRLLAATLLLAALPARAQTSASYHLNEHTFNVGGQPAGGAVSTSASFHLRLDALGDGVIETGMASVSFHADGGFVGDYPPPGEVLGLQFSSGASLAWSPEKSVGQYEVYSDAVSSLRSGGTGTCLQSGLTTTSAADATTPAVGSALFYLVTARNRLNEEGTKGYRSSGAELPNTTPCP